MSAPVMRLDFAAGKRRPRIGAIVLLSLGVLAVAAAATAYQQARQRTDGLELRLAALSGSARPAAQTAGIDDGKLLADAQAAVAELATPWGRLLDELTSAAADSHDSVALLAVEPDRKTLKVRILAESRDLTAAVAFAGRLQQSEVLRYPLLDSHEIRTDDRQRPVRFEITAAWRRGT